MAIETVVTIVAGAEGGLKTADENRLAADIKSLGVERLRTDWLASGRALDIIASGNSAQLTADLRQKLQNAGPFDIFIQPLDDDRRKGLLLADMDATMVEGETLDDLAAHLNLKDKIAPITAQAMRGELDFAEALRLRVGLLKGLPVSALFETLEGMRYSKGAASLVKTMGRYGAKCVLISGGFDIFTRHVAGVLGFYRNIGNRLEIENDRLTGNVLLPIVDKDTKRRTLFEETEKLGLTPARTMAVGDGANDIPMLEAAGAGVGYFGKPAVQAATPHQVRHTDLTALLYMQGYRKEFILAG
ncbi:MAG TPA: phosphoserine phosphatase SerB [Alphaproteobacteria bacterium]|nr:phosphoserine phosphatase SerB [Alphaproteobacteria bacterium]